ncbi:MFS transporter [Acetobacterium paludosum]|uniref:MFS transporter n=1 Tax=Acetobacterium paludosum TaxID=52693 RepID=A0A923I2X9_9FIRM|nr:MFS transporter [Acetobacterium paludosum]MBC3889003.1 MFS transporter [Acetobacterium paludosum]
MKKQNEKAKFGLILSVYLLGIFMGALDTGIVTPARTIIQNNLMVDEKTGIWMITIYTLAYAASIPVMGKLADKFGRKYIYLFSIMLFGVGSLLCGLSQNFGSFSFLLVARVIQAIGGGGILPVATAEFGTTFPEDKRGLALGLVGGVFGIANIFGASAGSAILDIFGINNWQFIFYVNVPITLFILIAGLMALPNTKELSTKKIDGLGILILISMVLSLLYGLKNIDFFAFNQTITSTSVYPFLLIFGLLLPVFILAEKKAEDPVINLNYFKSPPILITLFLSFITGVVMMGMIFVPQFAENALKIPSGSGGYFVIVLGLFAGIGAPFSGQLIDKFGAKFVLAIGFSASIAGSLFLIFVTTAYPNFITVAVCLILIGIGIGFTMGTPINYMMLDNTAAAESNSALATVSLIRSIGTAIAPAIMIGFISHAGLAVQTNVMNILPSEVNVPALPYAQEITETENSLLSNAVMKEKMAGIEIPDLSTPRTVKVNMNDSSGYTMPQELLDLMKTSDVTTITENSKTLAENMFATMTPDTIAEIQNGVQTGINAMNNAATEIESNIADLQSAYNGIDQGITGMETAITSQKEALDQLESLRTTMVEMQASASAAMAASASAMPASATMSGQAGASASLIDMIPDAVKNQMPQSVLDELSDVQTVDDLDNKIAQLQAAIAILQSQVSDSKASQAEMLDGVTAMQDAKVQINDTVNKMTALKNAVPDAFETAKNDYLAKIDNMKTAIEAEFQLTLNEGFKQVYLTVIIASVIALFSLAFYKNKEQDCTDEDLLINGNLNDDCETI